MDRAKIQAGVSGSLHWWAVCTCLLALPQVGCLNNWTAPAVIPDDPAASPVPRPADTTAPRRIPSPKVVQNDTLRIPASVGLPSAEERAYPVTQASEFAPFSEGRTADQAGHSRTADAHPAGGRAPAVGTISDEPSPPAPPAGAPKGVDEPLHEMQQMFGGETRRLPSAGGAGLPPDVISPWGDPPAMDTSEAPGPFPGDSPSDSPAGLPDPPAIDVDLPDEAAEFAPGAPQIVEPPVEPPTAPGPPPAPVPATSGVAASAAPEESSAIEAPKTIGHTKAEPISKTAELGGAEPAAAEIPDDERGDDPPSAHPLTAAESLMQTLELLRAEAALDTASPLDARLLQLLEVVTHPESQWPQPMGAVAGAAPEPQQTDSDAAWKAIATAASLELRDAELDRRLEQLEAAAAALQQQAPLTLKHLTFCQQIDDFGSYVEFDADSFAPGQELLLYVELEHFTHREAKQGYVIEIQGGYEVVDGAGKVVESREFLADKQNFRRPRRDYYVPYRLYVPEKIADGDYTLRLTLKDGQSGKTGEGSIALPVRSEP